MQRFAVIGIGQFGRRLTESLTGLGAEVLAIDSNEQVIESLRGTAAQAIVLDATNEAAFRACGVEDVDTAVVGIGRHLEISILVVAQLVRLGVPHIVGRASSPIHEHILRLIGANHIVNPEEAMGDTVARRLMAPDMHERLVLPTGHEWVEIDAPPAFWSQTLGQLALGERVGVHVVAIRRHRPYVDPQGKSTVDREVVMRPKQDDVIAEGDILCFVGTDTQIRELTRL